MKIIGMHIMLLCLFLGCSLDNEIAQYIVSRNDSKFKPIAKVVYKVSVDRQEIVYWIEVPGQARSRLFKMIKCTVVDKNNWEGETGNYSWPLWTLKVKFVDGKFKYSNVEFGDDVSWWTWHFKTEPKPSNLALISGSVIIASLVIGIIIQIRDSRSRKKKK